jgi:hypothetical protein
MFWRDVVVYAGKIFAVFALFAGVIFAFMYFTLYASCEAKWERSGLQSEFGIFQGCLVRLPDGRWLPSERLRELEVKP